MLLPGCDSQEEPTPENQLLLGKWKVVTHEGTLKPYTGADIPAGYFYLAPRYSVSGGDSLYWQFEQGGHVKIKDAFVRPFGRYPGVPAGPIAYPADSVFLVPEQALTWKEKEGSLFVMISSETHQYKIEKLDQDSLVLWSQGVTIWQERSQPLMFETLYASRVRLARWNQD